MLLNNVHKALKIFIVTVFCFLALLNLIRFFVVVPAVQTFYISDFPPQLLGARIIKNGEGKSLYSMDVQRKYQDPKAVAAWQGTLLPFRNIPLVGALYVPFTFLKNPQSGFLISIFMNMVLLFTTCALSVHYFVQRLCVKTLLIFLTISLAFTPVFYAFVLGQISFGILLILLVVILQLQKTKSLSGSFASLLFLKINYLPLVPFLFLLSRNKKAFAGQFGIGTLLILFANFYIVGFDFLSKYFSFLLLTEGPTYGTFPGHVFSVSAFLSLLPIDISSYFHLLTSFLCYLGIFLLFLSKYKSKDFTLNLISVLLLVPVFSFHTQVHDLVIVLLPLFYLARKNFVEAKGSLLELILLASLLFLTASFFGTYAFITPTVLLLVGVYFFVKTTATSSS